jgi:hypothetical protein
VQAGVTFPVSSRSIPAWERELNPVRGHSHRILRSAVSTLVSIACYAFPADALAFDEYLTGDNNSDEPG